MVTGVVVTVIVVVLSSLDSLAPATSLERPNIKGTNNIIWVVNLGECGQRRQEGKDAINN